MEDNRAMNKLAKQVKNSTKMDILSLGKFFSYVLRHNPSAVGITLDNNGYANVDELIVGVQKSGRQMDMATLEEIVITDEKGRFSFDGYKTKIRANYGHSICVDLQLQEQTPPNVLYHGTAEKYVESIKENGLHKKARNFVHLSADCETAQKVGARHGKPIVLEINARLMAKDGYRFYLSTNGIWLTDVVPAKYIIDY